jgi:hypothetical protein
LLKREKYNNFLKKSDTNIIKFNGSPNNVQYKLSIHFTGTQKQKQKQSDVGRDNVEEGGCT